MKAIIIMALLFILLLAACAPKDVFMRGYKVGSGNYYLTAQNGRLLFDDPHILHQYRNQVRVRKLKFKKSNHCRNNPLIVIASAGLCLIPEQEKGDNTLTLIHKEKGVVHVLESGYTYDMPYEMHHTAKRLEGYETWHNPEEFLQRINQLRAIKGASILFSSKIEPPPVIDPVDEYTVTIYFPLLIIKQGDDFSANETKDYLRNRLEQEMSQLGITSYQVTAIKHHIHGSSFSSEESIMLHRHYSTLVPPQTGRLHSVSKEYLSINGYRTHLFVIQLKCDKFCADSIEKRQPLDWLSSKSNIPHEELINKIKDVVEQAGGTFNPDFTIFNDAITSLPPDYINSPKPYTLSGKIEVIEKPKPKVELKVHWIYNLQRALNHPYPAELVQGQPPAN